MEEYQKAQEEANKAKSKENISEKDLSTLQPSSFFLEYFTSYDEEPHLCDVQFNDYDPVFNEVYDEF